jgi:hypothetical protein
MSFPEKRSVQRTAEALIPPATIRLFKRSLGFSGFASSNSDEQPSYTSRLARCSKSDPAKQKSETATKAPMILNNL